MSSSSSPSRRRPAASSSGRATTVTLSFDSNLRSSLADLPPSVHTALVSRDIPPQNIVLQLTRVTDDRHSNSSQSKTTPDTADGANEDRHTVYFGWSGQSSNLDSTLTLSASLADLFKPSAQPSSSYQLTLLRSPPLPTATRVDLTPLTPDDWELLSQNAGAVEDNMLSQVRAVAVGSRVCIFVGRGGGQECWFSVDATEPTTSPAPSASSSSEKAAARAVRLTTNTEIVIAPRTRQSLADAAAQQSHSLNANGAGPSTSRDLDSVMACRAALKNRLYKVLPADMIPTLADEDLDVDDEAPMAVFGSGHSQREAADSDWDLIAQAFAGGDASWTRATINVQPCPSAPRIRPLCGPSNIKAGGANGDKGSGSEVRPSKPTATAYVARGKALKGSNTGPWPRRWIWLNAALRQKLGGVGLGETVCFSAPPPGGSVSSPPVRSSEQIQAVTATSLKDQDDATGLAGVSSLLSTLREQVLTSVMSHSLSSRSASSSTSNILLHGPSGVGKTSILHTLAFSLQASLNTTLYVDCTSLVEQRVSQLKATFQEWKDALDWYAHSSSGAILMLDNLDKVLIGEVENVDPTRARTMAECFIQVFSQNGTGNAIVLGTALSNTSLHKLLVEKHFWNETLSVKPPGKGERSDILAHLIKLKSLKSQEADGQGGRIVADPSLNTVHLASQTEGYLPADLVDLVDRSIYRAAVRLGTAEVPSAASNAAVSHQPQVNGHVPLPHGRSLYPPLNLLPQDFTSAQENFTPLSLRSLSLSTSSVSWSSIGGLSQTRRVLRETLEFPARYAQIFEGCPLRLRSGLLLYGYPGCGKTMLASAVAKECGANFVSVKGPELLNKYIGASEKSVRDLFERASSAKPCVLFFDEFDSIAPKRGHDSTGVTDRVVNQLLTQMDGAEGLSGVYVLAATSRPDLIDSALLRPGRLDKSLLCDMPSAEDRADILRAVVREGKISVDPAVEWEHWAGKTEGFSGADLQAFVYNAHLEVVHEGIADAQASRAEGGDGAEEGGKEGDGSSLRFVEYTGQGAKDGSAGAGAGAMTKRSGAEEQALRRRLELALRNSRKTTSSTPIPASASGKSAPAHVNGDDSGAAAAAAAAASSALVKATPRSKVVTTHHLERSLASMRPSVPAHERRRLERIYREFAGEKRGGEFGDGEASKEIGARESLM